MRRAVATIKLSALAHNLRRVRAFAPRSRVIAAIKADAYGHGAVRAAHALEDADAFAVATLDEALQLRWAGIAKTVVVLSEAWNADSLASCVEHGFEPLVYHATQLDALPRNGSESLSVWIKIDTGMHRLGFAPSEAVDVYRAIEAHEGVRLRGWMTHLACADDSEATATGDQIRRFNEALSGLPGERSIANSAGVVAWTDTHVDAVRPGIMLYGASPMLDRSAESLGLRPVMTLSAPLISRKPLAAGEPVGYGATWHSQRELPLGTVGIGYGDGFPRHAPSGTPVLVDGRRVPLVGRVSMDMITVDLSAAPDAKIGDRAVLWGDGLPADEIATASGTIAYELFCRLTPRVTFDYQG